MKNARRAAAAVYKTTQRRRRPPVRRRTALVRTLNKRDFYKLVYIIVFYVGLSSCPIRAARASI